MEVLTELNGTRGITIAMVTHDQGMAAYAHRIVEFLDGAVLSDRATVPVGA